MAFQMVRNFFGQGSPSRSGAHEPVIESESFGNQGGTAHYDTRDVGKTATDSNWFELARHNKEMNEEGRKPHIGASNAGPESSSLPANGHPNTPEDSVSSEDETRQDRTLRNRSRRSNLADEIPSSTTPPNWDDYPEPAPPKPATPVPHIDANARCDNARIAVQYAEERTSHVQWQQNGAAMQVESTDFPIQNVELRQSNSIQTAYTPVLMPTQRSEDLALRRSNVDGNFYSHEFDREEMVEVMDEERSQTSSFEEQWKTRVFETQPRRVRSDPFQIPNGSLRERVLPSAVSRS